MGLHSLPRFDGALLCDEDTRRRFSSDVARNVQHVPLAVLKPGSVQDVIALVRYANEHGLTVAMRGQGHSRYGQSLADGFVIDSSALNAVGLLGPDAVDAQAGATWGETTRITLEKGLTVPAMGTCPGLSVGGILSVGGYSNSSHRYGAIADAAEELDAVTGDGRLLTCSARLEPELFEMLLAGMGQCALILRARLKLVAAPECVVRQNLVYRELHAFLADAARLVASDAFDHVNSRAIYNNGAWQFVINVGKFYSGAEPDLSRAQAGLHFTRKDAAVSTSYWHYLEREEPRNRAGVDYRQQHSVREPSLVVFVPYSAAEPFAEEVLNSADDLMGLADFQLNAFHVSRFRCPLFRFPEEAIAFGLWLYPRYIPLDDEQSYAKAMNGNRRMLEKMCSLGGKAYPPYAPYFSPLQWKEHYGPQLWGRLDAAKQQYDPNHVLTPGPGMFSRAASED